MEGSTDVFRPGGLDLTRRLAECCAFSYQSKIVDIGCGTGVTVEYLRTTYDVDAVGVDLSASRIQQGNDRIPGSPLILAPGEELPFADTSLDGVLAECSLSVMNDAAKVLSECNRVLSSGGKLGISDLYDRTAIVPQDEQSPDTHGILSYSKLVRLLDKYGFDIIFWEDQSSSLKEYVASYIIQGGSPDHLWHGITARLPDPALRPSQLGYFLLVAKKRLHLQTM
mgnify:CR=1 FL=1